MEVTDDLLALAKRVGQFLDYAVASQHPVPAVAKWQQFCRHYPTIEIDYQTFTRVAALAGFTIAAMPKRDGLTSRHHNIARRRRPTNSFDLLEGMPDYARMLPKSKLTLADRRYVTNAIHDMTFHGPARYDDLLFHCRTLTEGRLSNKQFKQLVAECNCRLTDRRIDGTNAKVVHARPYKGLREWLAEDWDGKGAPVKTLYTRYKATGGGIRSNYNSFLAALRHDPSIKFYKPPNSPTMHAHRPLESGDVTCTTPTTSEPTTSPLHAESC